MTQSTTGHTAPARMRPASTCMHCLPSKHGLRCKREADIDAAAALAHLCQTWMRSPAVLVAACSTRVKGWSRYQSQPASACSGSATSARNGLQEPICSMDMLLQEYCGRPHGRLLSARMSVSLGPAYGIVPKLQESGRLLSHCLAAFEVFLRSSDVHGLQIRWSCEWKQSLSGLCPETRLSCVTNSVDPQTQFGSVCSSVNAHAEISHPPHGAHLNIAVMLRRTILGRALRTLTRETLAVGHPHPPGVTVRSHLSAVSAADVQESDMTVRNVQDYNTFVSMLARRRRSAPLMLLQWCS